MFNRFYPDIYVKDIYSIKFEELKKNGINTLVFDLDNTIAPFDIEYPSIQNKDFFKVLKEKGFTVLIVSNNKQERVEKFSKDLDIKFISKAGKPKITKIKNFILENGGEMEKSAIIGDQLFTDMWVGTKLKLKKILVEPIANRDEFTVKLKRGLEKKVFKVYLKRHNIKDWIKLNYMVKFIVKWI